MSYNGLEIDMLSLGNADSILVTKWNNGVEERVLIDGGNKNDAETVKNFLVSQDINYIHHVVCTHPHDDHAGGLIELIKDEDLFFGKAWVHMPEMHIDLEEMYLALYSTSNLNYSKQLFESIKTNQELLTALMNRDIEIEEPFTGKKIGFFTVCGPTVEYYESLVNNYTQIDQIKHLDELINKALLGDFLTNYYESSSNFDSKSLSENPSTSPENNCSAILATIYDDDKYLFTGDAGTQALSLATSEYNLTNCSWMQIPHHGSRRNITQGLIEYFSPCKAFVSAKGDKKHPRISVINAFKKLGAKVFSTHYPNGGNLRQYAGDVPYRPNQLPATPLWEAKKLSPV